MKFEIFQSPKNKKYYFNLKARNGQVILTSEGYEKMASAKAGVKSVVTNAKKSSQFDRKVAKDGKCYFNLIAANKKIVGGSQRYATQATMEKGIKAVCRVAPEAVIVDMTK